MKPWNYNPFLAYQNQHELRTATKALGKGAKGKGEGQVDEVERVERKVGEV